LLNYKVIFNLFLKKLKYFCNLTKNLIIHNQVLKAMTTEESFQESLFKENWSWVDRRLEELYYGYALTVENSDEYAGAGLLTERWAWVDKKLENQYNNEENIHILCPAPIAWINDNEKSEKHFLLEEQHQEQEQQHSRGRAESDISDHSDTVERVISRLSPLSCSSECFVLDSDSDTEYNYLYDDRDGYDSH
jgi:hypothetical protein